MHHALWDGGSLFLTDEAPRCVLIYIVSSQHQDVEALFSALDTFFPFALALFTVEDWNSQLSPWEADAVFGNEGFSGGGTITLAKLESSLSSLPENLKGLPLYVGGASLAGLFALWVLHNSCRFSGCAAVSGSFWYPGLVDYISEHSLPSDAKVYLSLGKKEHNSRNRQMRTVNSALEQIFSLCSSRCVCKLEWNEGNHFTDPLERMRKGFAWLMVT